MIDEIKQIVGQEIPQTVANRRYIHQNPGMSFREEGTMEYLCQQLTAEKISWRRCGKNGIVARIQGNRTGPCIAFRGDFDALGIQEPEGLPFASRVPGVMHACGHDAHAAMLLSLARLLQQNRQLVRGEVVFIFQYAEELPPGGAGPMIADGCLDGVDRIYGLHVTEEIDTGAVGICNGKYMAASDSFFINFRGDGGHGSSPWETPDTVSAAATAITQINAIVSRFVKSNRSAVISVCNLHGGVSYNVIPDLVRLEGTVRSYEKETSEGISRQLERTARAAAEIYGAQCEFSYAFGYPAVVNHDRECDVVRQAARLMGRPVVELEPTPVGEDFARYLQQVPGAFFRVGIRNEKKGSIYPLHNRRFLLDEDALAVGLETFLGIYLLETGQL